MKKKVLVAMSGGVDSAVAAYLLKKEGYEVTGITMDLGVSRISDTTPGCGGLSAVKATQEVCQKLRIPHTVVDFSPELEEKVITPFVSAYFNGETPNPCVECNRYLKFGRLLKEAVTAGFDFLATGHYARIEKENGVYYLKRPKDRKKDQTYFLYSLSYESLPSILFPLANLTKDEVRKLAASVGIPVAGRAQSQDICFIPSGDYKRFIAKRVPEVRPGPIVDRKGTRLGEHKGLLFYTVGQRGGLGISASHPLYVLSLNREKNQLVVGEKKDTFARELLASRVNFLCADLPEKLLAQIRSTHQAVACRIIPKPSAVKVIFREPQSAITPGQSIVFYSDDTVVGGGEIKEVIDGYN